MNNRLEHYLKDAEQALQALPPARRLEEMDEMRQHLNASVRAHEELGLDLDAATEQALHQFGQAQQVGASLKRVWWREQISGPGGLWKTVALAVALRCAVYGLLSPLTNAISFAYSRLLHEQNFSYPGLSWIVIGLLITALPSVVVGVGLARLAPRNAVVGAVLGSVLGMALPQMPTAGTLWSGPMHDPLQAILLVGTAWVATRHERKRLTAAR